MEEFDSFSDYSFHYEIQIVNTKNKRTQDYKFTTIDGRYDLEFSCKTEHPRFIYIKGFQLGRPSKWLVPLNKNMIEEISTIKDEHIDSLMNIVKLNRQFTIKKSHAKAEAWQRN